MRELRKAGFTRDGDTRLERGSEGVEGSLPPLQTKPCSECLEPFPVQRIGQDVCSPKCAIAKVRKAKEVRQAARKAKTEYRKKTIGLSKLKNLAQREVNRYVRERDFDEGCISCDMPANYGGQWHAGHYRTTAAAPQLRYDVRQIRKQCAQCNSMKSGNVIEYRKRLVLLIGIEAVEEIENDNRIHRWSPDELIAIRKDFHGRWRALVAEREGKA